MFGIWVITRQTQSGKQYLAQESPERVWVSRLGMAKLFFQEDAAQREATWEYRTEKVSV